jgi:NADH dehydrogenase
VLAWFMHRTYHVSKVPTFNRKARVVADWTLSLFFKREIVSLWSMHEPFTEFQQAAGTTGVGTREQGAKAAKPAQPAEPAGTDGTGTTAA